MKSYAISSAVPAAPITATHALAFERSLRRLEAWWKDYLTGTLWKNGDGTSVDLGAIWEQRANVDVLWSPETGVVPEDTEASVVQLVEQLSNAQARAAGFIAYHSVDSAGRPFCEISYAMAGADWPSAVMHEMQESRVNGLCTGDVTLPGGVAGTGITGLEVADWVEGSDYEEVGCPGIWLSNAVGPGFFLVGTTRAEGLDIASDLRAPSVTAAMVQLPGGYHDVEAIGAGTETFVYGEMVTDITKARLEAQGVRGGMVRKARAA